MCVSEEESELLWPPSMRHEGMKKSCPKDVIITEKLDCPMVTETGPKQPPSPSQTLPPEEQQQQQQQQKQQPTHDHKQR